MKELGDCYEAAGKVIANYTAGNPQIRMMESVGLTKVLCHGMVVGTKGVLLGTKYDHAWVEIEGAELVYDNSGGANVICPRDVYYAVGNVTDVRRYTREEASAMMLKHGHYGPWEENL